jgi:glyoxylase-like metal-dependent hydrolase (beta-lactamase superfamily II)
VTITDSQRADTTSFKHGSNQAGRLRAMTRLIALAALLFAACAPRTSAPARDTDQPFTLGHVVVTPLGNGVYAATRAEPLALAVNANSLFIVNDDHVVVVDAQFTRQATAENIAALKRITSKPVRFVINTHWHDDHVAGNQVYQDSFPGVRFIATTNTRKDLIDLGRPNRTGQVQGAPPLLDRFERLLELGLGADSTAATQMERESLSSAVRVMRQYIAENTGYREVLPDSTFERLVTLRSSGRTIEVHWFGRGNTRGDAVTYLPAERIVSTGDLLVAPVPFAFGSYPGEWLAVLDSIKALQPRILMPGHGPVMRDLTYLNTVHRMISTARQQTAAAVANGLSADSAMATVRLEGLRDEIAGSEKQMRVMFASFFRRPIVERAYAEAKNGAASR